MGAEMARQAIELGDERTREYEGRAGVRGAGRSTRDETRN